MAGVLDGVRVVEVASYLFVPAGGAVLADWGADVIKVEDPVRGDPQRGLNMGTLGAKGAWGISFIVEQPNRGKRSLGLNIGTERGRELLLELVAKADVFLTNLLPVRLRQLGLDVDDLRAVNPAIIIARGTGQGVRGEDADKAGFDGSSYWARGGIAHMLSAPGAAWPLMQRPAFGDIMGGFVLASGVAAALYKRERTGEPSVLDVSLFGVAAWQLAPDIVAAGLIGEENMPRFTPDNIPNPIVNYYKTSDGRFVMLMMLQSDRFWPEVCALIGRPDLAGDARFATSAAREENRAECIALLREAFAARPLAEWRTRMSGLQGAWAVVQTPAEVLTDPQARANGYILPVPARDGAGSYDLVASPVQFDEMPPELTRAPDSGEHTDQILADELGLDQEAIRGLRASAVVS
jgi:crotonobetainyl-CoA:carnitine CoA-transferase CaiB-like acyl-CoA transferase